MNISWRFQFFVLFQKDFAKFWWFWRPLGGPSRKNLGIRLQNFYYFCLFIMYMFRFSIDKEFKCA